MFQNRPQVLCAASAIGFLHSGRGIIINCKLIVLVAPLTALPRAFRLDTGQFHELCEMII